MQWLKQNTSHQIDVLLLKDGPVKEDFQKASSNCYVLHELINPYTLKKRIKKKFGYKSSFGDDIAELNNIIDFTSYQMVYGNTAISLEWVICIKGLYGVKVIAAIHEMQYFLSTNFTTDFLEKAFSKLDLLIAGSHAVANDIKQNYKVGSLRIEVVHAFIDTSVPVADGKALLKTAGVPAEKFIIGCAGYADWRKGADLVIWIAAYLRKYIPNFDFHIVWLGANLKEHFASQLAHDIKKSGFGESITLLEGKANYKDYINGFDVFAMLSREDPFPLVSLEAAYLEKPIVMFEGTGGTAELLANGGGTIVPYLDIEAMGNVLHEISKNKPAIHTSGSILKKEVTTKYTSEVMSRNVLQLLGTV